MCVCVCGQPHKHPQAAEQADEHFLIYLASNNANHGQKVEWGEQVKHLRQRRLRKERIFFPQLQKNCSLLLVWKKHFIGFFFVCLIS